MDDRVGIWLCNVALGSLILGCSGSPSPAVQSGGSGGMSVGGANNTNSTGGSPNNTAGGSTSASSTSSTGGTWITTGGTSVSNTSSTGGASTAGGGTSASSSLPEGNQGIAARHPGDVGIASDSNVIFADDFESYAKSADLNNRWDAVYQNQYANITTTAANVYSGKQALEFTLPQQTAELSDSTDKVISPERDVLFLRYYSKFQPPYDVVGSSHNGSSISAHYFINGQATPGVPADGTNKFLANLEDWRGDATTASPGYLNVYAYHPEQRSQWGDHFFPNGDVMPNTSIKFDFGPNFVSRAQIIPDLDRWYCYEFMVQANTPGQRDGRIAGWLDGKLVMDFMNLRLRDVASLKIDRFGISFHIGSNPNGEAKKWYDDVVAASSYIGPMVAP